MYLIKHISGAKQHERKHIIIIRNKTITIMKNVVV